MKHGFIFQARRCGRCHPLSEERAKVNAGDKQGETPLHHAAWLCETPAVLMDAGVGPAVSKKAKFMVPSCKKYLILPFPQ